MHANIHISRLWIISEVFTDGKKEWKEPEIVVLEKFGNENEASSWE